MARTSTTPTAAADVLLLLLKPADVARTPGCSQSRNRPRGGAAFTKAGGAYRFTIEHVHEIVRIYEERPSNRQ
jgi:hypothetical protein